MKKFYILVFLLIAITAVSQINSPNGNNIFEYDGAADVTFKYPLRGSGGRAFVHYPNNILSLNYNEDFTGGTLIGKSVFFKDNGNSYISSGNFGIGTSGPNARLYVNEGDIVINKNGSGILRGDNYNYGSGGAIKVSSSNTISDQYIQLGRALTGTGEFFPHLTVMSNSGNVGIGVFNPTQKLEVSGGALFQGVLASTISDNGGGKIELRNPSKALNGIASTWAIYNMTGVYGNSLQFWAYDNLGCGNGLCNNRFTIMDNGNVGIGQTNPSNKLDVNGTIHSREVKVDMKDWSDFVFKKEYNLPTLEEVEKHIAEKGHLKNIPNEEEVLKNGINLGEMNAKLLQKIEELTLYIIEIKKENQRQNEKQNEEIENLKGIIKLKDK
ncbi:hypothetical protein LPB248_01325 [Flavobacterium sp. LPB0248]|uniref:hypothetical protein n=1 Tax=Flavobacterium sp. LPB0248 TaxID=2614441 RepID=UPI0015A6DB45|nr:hypothetical protein [Flavobacterium sp. LPB0248]QLC64962.1 hypothetical protein LPB248_01325 [Flavobacterium sp. LPB0248]